jgi:hypothetical protein
MKVRFRGSPSFVGMLAQMLRDEGLEVDYAPPLEDRGAGDTLVEVVLYVAGKGVDVAVVALVGDKVGAAIKRFRERVPRAQVNIVDDTSRRKTPPATE